MSFTLKHSLIAVSVIAAVGTYTVYHSKSPAEIPAKLIAKDKQLQERAKKPKYSHPKEAAELFNEKRMPLGADTLPVEKYHYAQQAMQKLPHYDLAAQAFVQPGEDGLYRAGAVADEKVERWEELGPGIIGGRTRALLFHPTTPEVMYTAGVSGGVWKTIDEGKNWKPLNDLMTHLAVTTLNFKPSNPDVIYAGTGEGFSYNGIMRGNGIYVTTDAGSSWSALESTVNNEDFYYIYRVAISELNADVLYAATNGGLMKSENAGKSWKKIVDGKDFTFYHGEEPNQRAFQFGCLDIELRNDKEVDHIFLSCGTFAAPSKVLISKDGGENWTVSLSSADEGNQDFGRIELAIAPSQPDTVYALVADNKTHALNTLYRSDDAGETWKVQVSKETPAEEAPFGRSMLGYTYGDGVVGQQCLNRSGALGTGQGWYDLALSVDPVDPDRIWVGGVDVLRSDNGGKNFGIVSQWWLPMDHERYIHADNHIFAFHPQYDGKDNKTMYVGNDGGIQRTLDATANIFTEIEPFCDLLYGRYKADPAKAPDIVFENMNNDYAVTQFYHGDASADGTRYAAGSQDNGTIMGGEELGYGDWEEIRGGDGGYTSIDPTNKDIIYSSYVYDSLRRSEDGGRSWVVAHVTKNAANQDNGFRFITPHLLDKNNPTRLWTGGNYIWRTDNQGDNWTKASTIMPSNGRVTAFAVANGNSEKVAVATGHGYVLRSNSASTTDADTEWQASLPTRGYISSLAFDPKNSNILYATYSTFGVNHVWRSLDGGLSWTAIDGKGTGQGLPDIPAHSIVVDPNDSKRLYVGTDLGLFVSFNAGQSWVVENTDFANVMTEHLAIVDNVLYAFTYGRGVYRVSLNDLPQIQLSNKQFEFNEDEAFNFSESLYKDDFKDATEITHIYVDQLPKHGQLSIADKAVVVGQHISLADFGKLMYQPEADYFGQDEFFVRGSNGKIHLTTKGQLQLNVQSVNDAPGFGLNRSNYTLEHDFQTPVVVRPLVGHVPENEKTQTVTYSIYPASSSLVNVAFDNATGELQLSSITGQSGTQMFTVVADDGQNSNDTFEQSVEVTVEPKPKGGSLFGLLLLGVAGLMLRRKA